MLKIKKYAALDIGSNAVRLLITSIIEQEGKAVIFKKNALVRVPIRLGADVFVVYSNELVKVYQERTLNSVTTYARFDNGQVVDYGSFNNPMVGNASAPVVIAEKD